MSVIIVPDPHIGGGYSIGKPGLGIHLNSRAIDQFKILDFILDTAIDSNVSSIIITGDCFDQTKPELSIVSLFIEWLHKCSNNNISVHIILGNHDLLRSGQYQISILDIISAAEIENIFVYKDISTVNMLGISFTFFPFKDRKFFNVGSNKEALRILQNKIPYEIALIDRNNIKIAVAHLAIEGSIPALNEIDDMTNELFCPAAMFKDYQYTFCGHIHRFQELSQNPYVAHIGSMDISDFSEQDQKKYIVIIDLKSKPIYKYIEIPTRPLKQILVSVPDNIVDTTSYVIKEIKDKYNSLKAATVRLIISFESPDLQNVDRSKIEACLNDLGVYNIVKISEEKKVILVKKDNALQNMDNTINEAVAIRLFAEVNVEENIRSEFISIANNIIKECS